MASTLAERARDCHIPIPQERVDMVRTSYLLEIIPDMMRSLIIERCSLSEIANRYSMPPEVPMSLENAWKAIMPESTPTTQGQIVPTVEWTRANELLRSPAGIDVLKMRPPETMRANEQATPWEGFA
jgi:hypothetical protein